MIEKHVEYTQSPLGKKILSDWDNYSKRFTKVIPKAYKKMMENIAQAYKEGLTGEVAIMTAFTRSIKK